MDIDDFLDITKPTKRNVIQGSANNAYCPVEQKDSFNIRKRVNPDPNYANTLKAKQEREFVEEFVRHRKQPNTSFASSASSDEPSTSHVKADARSDTMFELYKKYKFNSHPFNKHLPIYQHRRQIMNRIEHHPVVVIKGETGCGKSTQVPQFILDDAFDKKMYCNVVVTQPRRIAATSLAEQVARERGCDLNTFVGYQIGLEREVSEDTRLLYCTTGVLLQKLVQTKSMAAYTHIILDEVHERDEEMEFLLILIKRFLIRDPFTTKVILMSATINTEEFSNYFRFPSKTIQGGWTEAPTIDLESERQFKVTTYYLEDMQHFAKRASIDYERPGIDSSMYTLACMLIMIYCKPEYAENGNCILVFLPGLHEIVQMYRVLQAQQQNPKIPDASKLLIICLHSTIPSDQQRSVFVRAPPNVTKVILSTNIAESSITVPDVRFVIDFCLTRTLECDPSTGFSTLVLKWASKSSCQQRAGRTGRTANGRCYRLVSRGFYENEMRENETPALERCSLEKIVLKAKMVEENLPPQQVIGLAINPPDMTDITYTVLNLKEARGLHFKTGKRYDEYDGELTFVGRIMDALPIDIRATRLIVLGYVFSVMEECIIIAAGITVQKVFALDMKNPMKTYNQKLAFADGSGSDLIAMLHAYQYWLRKVHDSMDRDEENRERTAERLGLDLKGLYEMYHLVKEINKRLEPFKLAETDGVARTKLSIRERNIILKVCIAGAFYPNFFVRSATTNLEDKERQMFHELNGRDPCNTVFYRGLAPHQMGVLYQNQIKEYLRSQNVILTPDDVKVSFDQGSEKVYVTFLGKQELIDAGSDENRTTSDWMPGKIQTQVYKALKLAREREKCTIRVMDDKEMVRYAEEINFGRYENGAFVPNRVNIKHEDLCILPNQYVSSIIGRISSIVTPNKFWFKPLDGRNEQIFTAIRTRLNDRRLEPFTELSELKGKIVAAKAQNEEERVNLMESSYHRAKVLAVVMNREHRKYQVQLIDEGEEAILDLKCLRNIDSIYVHGTDLGLKDKNRIYLVDIPPRAFQCTLAEIQPSYITSSAGKWTVDALNEFKELVSECDLVQAEVYSVWNGIASVNIYDNDRKSISKILIRRQKAQSCEENYPSKYDHAQRFIKQNFEKVRDMNEPVPMPQEFVEYLTDFYSKPVKPPPIQKCMRQIKLRGPHSPLETKLYACSRTAAVKLPNIERHSVNCVLLDTDPQDPTERLYVAATVGRNSNNNDLILRNTTAMPQLPGFPVMMALLFSPMLEIHRDPKKTRYNSVLCGMGYNEITKEPYYSEHDLVLNFDVYMDQDDMTKANKIRYTMSALLHTQHRQQAPNIKPKDIHRLNTEAVKDLLSFLQKPRPFIDLRSHYRSEFDWGCVEERDLMSVEGSRIYGDNAIFPGFLFMKLEPETNDDITRYRENNQELHAIAFCNSPMPPGRQIDCLLCSTTLTNKIHIQVHLFTKLHKDRAEQCHCRFQIEHYKSSKSKYFSSEKYFESH